MAKDGADFKRDFNLIIKERSEEKFDSKFNEFRNKYTQKYIAELKMASNDEQRIVENKSDNHKITKIILKKDLKEQRYININKYLDDIYEDRENWAFCFTHVKFTAGIILANILFIFY